ncbi:MAG: molybdenum cofactor guanylyltransferase MobA [Rhodospirillales bacterium]|nr:molybdenum cofactor guanylyltransferase MobA [Rhodospirillales bacterium]
MNSVVAVILAGGEARRMGGGDKCLLEFGGQTLLDWILARIRPQVRTVILNANGDPARFAQFDLPVVPDIADESLGPLLGIVSGLTWVAENAPDAQWVVTVPGDTPFPPGDLVGRFMEIAARPDVEVVCAVSGGRTYPPCSLWNVDLAGELREAVIEDRILKIDQWTETRRIEWAEFETGAVDPFFNVNSPEDLRRAEALARELLG